jgi:hypothetical protein
MPETDESATPAKSGNARRTASQGDAPSRPRRPAATKKTGIGAAAETGRSSPPFDRFAATGAALVIVGLAVFLLVRNEPIADPKLFFVMRVIMSFSAAMLGATIPGFLDLKWSGSGLAVRSGGAVALFVLTFVYTPDAMEADGKGPVTISAPGGVAAKTITGSPITINTAPPVPSPAPVPAK